MKQSYVFLADGFEEIEAVAPVDILRRAGMEVKTVSVMPDRTEVSGAHGVKFVADMQIDKDDISDAEWLILPGGLPGASNLYACDKLCSLIKSQQNNGGKIAAICASPAVVLAPLGVLDGKRATCYPGFEAEIKSAMTTGNRVEIDGNLITANGPSSAMLFGIAIVGQTLGKQVADEVASGMLL